MVEFLRKPSYKSHKGLAGLMLVWLGLTLVLSVGFSPRPDAQAADLDANMVKTWERTDYLVSNGFVERSWMWGPRAFNIIYEDYADAPAGKRLVAYFDKSRMEINNPNGDRNVQWFVTNGLLVKELISGQMALGDSKVTKFLPASIRVAGDQNNNPNTPTYAALYNVATLSPNGANRTTNRIGQFVNQTIDARGTVGADLSFNGRDIKNAYYDETLGHNVPQPFWDFMNSRGPVWEESKAVTGSVVDWLFSTGLPLTEAYWARVRVDGVEKDVLIQAFERRVLTYTRDNAPAWRVEMGNVGLHYSKWRYQDNAAPNCSVVPVRGFGKLWGENPSVKVRIGCPYTYNSEQGTKIALLNFQYGKMLWVDSTQHTSYYPPNNWRKAIYILFDDGSYTVVADTWNESLPESAGLTPPANSLYEPKRSFGKVWRDNSALKLQERLGWATEPKEREGNGAAQNFGNGAMHWTSIDKQIFVLYSYYQGLIFNWEVYPDTFQG